MKKALFVSIALVSCVFLTPSVMASDAPPAFSQLAQFPASPAEASFGITAGALSNGLFILWDGDAIWLQDGVDADGFSVIADGYPGDPGFLAVSPDGHTVALGAGFGGDLYLFDADAPVSGGAAALNTGSHFWGAFLDEDHILLDQGTDDWNSVLVIVDLSGANEQAVVVQNKTNFSAALTVDEFSDLVYATDGMTGETRSFGVDALLSAFDTATPLDWSVDGELLGTFGNGGAMAVSDSGTLLFSHYDWDNFFGEVQFVDSLTGEVAGTVDPAADGGTYATAYNSETGHVLIIDSVWPGPTTTGWISATPYEGSQVVSFMTSWLLLFLILLFMIIRGL